jgi:aspartyl-tRNA(Asn)/glutamyl-tRNA(Gln) amidotransferase subunit C
MLKAPDVCAVRVARFASQQAAFRRSFASNNHSDWCGMSLTRAEVEKVSLLGRLLLTPAELQRMTAQLGQVVDYMNLLAELDTEGVEPMAHAIELTNVFRDDVVRPSLPREQALANAPQHDREHYLVPAVLGE